MYQEPDPPFEPNSLFYLKYLDFVQIIEISKVIVEVDSRFLMSYFNR